MNASASRPRVLHLIPNLLIGGAQRTVATLRRSPDLVSRVEVIEGHPPASLAWADIVVLHAWRQGPDRPDLNVPAWTRETSMPPVILFNHDWEGYFDGAADLVLVYSHFAAAHWAGPYRAAVLAGGITIDRFSRVAESRDWSTVSTVGRLSTLHAAKISPHTLGSWPLLAANVFWIGGGGSQLPSLLEACTDPRFRFAGEIAPSCTHEFLARIDIFLYETEWHVESFCYVILEALAAGCVVVASNRGAVGELIEHGVNGFMFEKPEESVTLCNQLIREPATCRAVSATATATAHLYRSDVMRTAFTRHVASVLARAV